jgi:ATP-dependent Clp protease ATP-binding subunit ClpX
MFRRRSRTDEEMRCSFCGKSQDQVDKLISTPPDRPTRAYVCNECIAVCNAILKDYEKDKPN